MYTIKKADGERDLTLEHGLSELENRFNAIRNQKLENHEILNVNDRTVLCAFATAMHARTICIKEYQQEFWGRTLEMMDQMKEWAETATSDQLNAISSFPSDKNKSYSYEEVVELAKNPLQHELWPTICDGKTVFGVPAKER